MMTSINKHLKDLIEQETKTSSWKSNDEYYLIKLLSIDQRGRVGEHFLRDVFTELNKKVSYINNGHNDFDLEVDNFKIEIKTATLDTNEKFQHEGIKDSKIWDAVAFLDITPNDLYLTILHKDKFEFGIHILDKNGKGKTYGQVELYGEKRNIHFRGKDNTDQKATGAGYKVDLPLNKISQSKIKTIKDIEILFENTFKNYK